MREVKYDGKHWRVYSPVVDDFISPELSSAEEVAKWVSGDCKKNKLISINERYLVSREDLTCHCKGSSFGREVEDELRFLHGVDPFRASPTPPGVKQLEISQEEYCSLLEVYALVDAYEAKLRHLIDVHT